MSRDTPTALYSSLIVVVVILLGCAGVATFVFTKSDETSILSFRSFLLDIEVSGFVALTITLFTIAVLGVALLVRVLLKPRDQR